MHIIGGKIFKHHNYIPLFFLAVMFLYRAPNIWSLITGLIVVIAGAVIRLWGAGYSGMILSLNDTQVIASESSTINAPELITSGPFAYLRYPLFLGSILLYSGICMMSFSLFPFLQLFVPVYFFLHYRSIIISHEKDLLENSNLNEVYSDYINTVPALLPKLKKYRNSAKRHDEIFSMSSAISLESGNIKAYGFLSITIILIWFIGRF
ncbi:MAG: methyltransferase family protein [Bacillota bacterium]